MNRELSRKMFDTVNISGTVVIGEGEMDEAPMLYIGEHVGAGGPEVDIAVDPVEGTNLVAKGQPGAIAVIAIAPKGCLLHAPDMYMDKIAVGPRAKGCIDINAPVSENLERVAKALDRKVSDLTVVLLDRERHYDLMDQIRRAGARIHLITDGDVNPIVNAGITQVSKVPACICISARAAHRKAYWQPQQLNALAAICRHACARKTKRRLNAALTWALPM